ncbi:hypothetical protein SARC_10386 [Sphaeroforma arctica JP610]|uniref:Mon2/Sec7/BIG1-like HUS domain-containing protein n=1 Tax=Sphaeroforma arctica JP610 TaxID=667725 RepID=A0A0L0FK68_9EUKA|nr:hypothetical protein SARC_10386 [Sphaeroforma arctica JP610]KNC77145.1 hypothetical protein SARC_10386 [Sphaeroforma arctica JP610]|eukprot:XP_014151047.1 hypothetical protein SARC_10386 [Sphaeroforma arctica JP610]
MCPIVIKSFSPSKRGDTAEGKQRVSYSTTQRLLRIVSVLIKNFQSTLVTESEIFLTMLVKFLHSDWPTWQQTLAIEVLRDLSAHPKLIRQYCECYDMQEHSAPVFSMIVAGVTKYIQTEVKTDAQTAYQNPSAGSNRYLLYVLLCKGG